MKKKLFLICIIVLLLFTSCTVDERPDPEDSVDTFLISLKDGDYVKALRLLNSDTNVFEGLPVEKIANYQNLVHILFDNLEYEILDETTIDEDTANVKVNITNVNFGIISDDLIQEVTSETISLALKGNNVTEEDIVMIVEKKLNDKLSDPNIEKKTTPVNIQLEYVDGRWTIVADEALLNAVSGEGFEKVGQLDRY